MPNFEQQPKTADQLSNFQKKFLETHQRTLNEQLSDLGAEDLAHSDVLQGAEERLAALYLNDTPEADIVAERDRISAEVRAEMAERSAAAKPAETVVTNEEGFTPVQPQRGADRRASDNAWMKGE